MLEFSGTGWEATASMMKGKSLLVRLFNSEGDETPQQVRFDGSFSKVEMIELNGEIKNRLEATPGTDGRIAVKLAVPRFGVRTLRAE